MKRLWGIIFILSSTLIICISSCSPKDSKHKKYYTLRVIIDTSSNFYLDSVSISAKFARDPFMGNYIERVYDSLYKSYAYKFDSVENGSLTIRLQSQLDRSVSKEIILDSDSVIFFTKGEISSFQNGNLDSLNFADMNAGEKICIGITGSGCFHHYTQKTIIQREADQYLVDFFSAQQGSSPPKKTRTTKRLNSSFKDSLLDFQSSAIKFIKKKRLGFCTSTISYLIQKGNTVYAFGDGTCSREISYYKILKMINPDWFKQDTESQENN